MSDTENLPALIEGARFRLAEAKSSAEVLEARELANAAFHVAKIRKASNETAADCLVMVALAEMRLAREIDAGRERGEVAGHGGDRRSIKVVDDDVDPATLADLGVRRDQLHDWRKQAAAGEEAVKAAVQAELEAGRAPTKAAIKRAVEEVHFRARGTGENEWYTPSEHIERARSVLGSIDLDPASSEIAQKRVRASQFLTVDDDGLTHEWRGRVWLNPPYAQPAIADFAAKIVEEVRRGRVVSAIMLTHNYTDTAWFHVAESEAASICFTRGRIRFESSDGTLASPTQGQAFFYYGRDAARFREVFADVGFIR